MIEKLTERVSYRELVVLRSFNAKAGLVYQAWTTPELMMRWWAPASIGITFLLAEMDVRVGGRYRFVFANPAAEEPMAFFGRYLEAVPDARLVWTNEEAPDGAVTIVTFRELNGRTEVVLRDLYPSEEALDAATESGSTSGYDEQCAELDALLERLTG